MNVGVSWSQAGTCWLIVWVAVAAAMAAGELPEPSADGQTVIYPVMHQRHLRNPGMGLVFYGIPDDPPEYADVLYFHLAWYDIEKTEGQFDFNTEKLQQAMKTAEKNGCKLAIRLVTSWQNYETPIPQYLLDRGVRLFPYRGKHAEGPKHFYEPEWWHPEYIKAHKRMVKAWGEFIDGHPLVAWIDARYYGFWGEGHRYSAVEPWPEDVDLRQYCKDRIDEYVAAFKKTPLVVQTAGDKDVPYPGGTAIEYAVAQGMWVRRDGFGCCINDQESRFIKENFTRSIVIAENAGRLHDFYRGDRIRNYNRHRLSNLDSLVDEMFEHRVNYFPLGWGAREYQLLVDQRPDILTRASLRTGYRFYVSRIQYSPEVGIGGVVTLTADWVNLAVGRSPFAYWPTAWMKDADGRVVSGSQVRDVDITQWVEGARYTTEFKLAAPRSLKPGTYTLWIGMTDDRLQPAIALPIEGDDGQRRFAVGTVTID